jgi:hypothetical protein
LDRISAEDLLLIDWCIREIEQDPYPPPDRRAPLVIPGRRTDPDAFRCGPWRISYRVVDDVFIYIEDIGRWPPRPSGS